MTDPLVGDTVAGRLGVSYSERRGTFYDVTSVGYVNEQDNLGAKAQVRFQPSESLDLTFSADCSRQNPLGYSQVCVPRAPRSARSRAAGCRAARPRTPRRS